jgi:predicted aconitase with swiveling domain
MAESAPTLRGTTIVAGAHPRVEGEAMACSTNLAFSLVDPKTGLVKQPGHPWFDRSIAGKVLLYPSGQGSAAGSWWLLNLSNEGRAPAAILNAQSDAVVIAGAVLADIPLVHRLEPDPFALLRDGDIVRVDTRHGTVEVLRVADEVRR